MPRYTLCIYYKGTKLRQYSGTRDDVSSEFRRVCTKYSEKWSGCLVEWGTSKGSIRASIQL